MGTAQAAVKLRTRSVTTVGILLCACYFGTSKDKEKAKKKKIANTSTGQINGCTTCSIVFVCKIPQFVVFITCRAFLSAIDSIGK